MTSYTALIILPDVIAVTEIRLNCNSSANINFPNYKFTILIPKQWLVVLVSTCHFPNYKFYITDSKTMAGGAGIYMSSSLNALPRSDLNFDSDGQLKSC